ncbi:hypothetical protein [Blastococcus sp. KM273128]|nr:hypothetical protein [Blastococcus sp. KM273128]
MTVTQLEGKTATALLDRVGPLGHEEVGQLIVDLDIARDAMEDG